MNLVPLNYFILNLNAAIDAGDKATLAEAKAHIRSGDLWDWLRQTYRLDVGVFVDPDRRDGREVLGRLRELLGGYDGEERRKWGVENNGLALLLAWANELVQQQLALGSGTR